MLFSAQLIWRCKYGNSMRMSDERIIFGSLPFSLFPPALSTPFDRFVWSSKYYFKFCYIPLPGRLMENALLNFHTFSTVAVPTPFARGFPRITAATDEIRRRSCHGVHFAVHNSVTLVRSFLWTIASYGSQLRNPMQFQFGAEVHLPFLCVKQLRDCISTLPEEGVGGRKR